MVYNEHGPGDSDGGLAWRAEQLANKGPHVPVELRRFCGSLSRHLHNSINSSTHLRQFQNIRSDLELYQDYLALRTRAIQLDPTLLDFLCKEGQKTSRGRSWVTVTIDYVCKELLVERSILSNTASAAIGVSELVAQFGNGILPLIPSTVPNK